MTNVYPQRAEKRDRISILEVKLWDLTLLDKNSTKFKDRITVTQQFMNQAASHLENRAEFCQAVEKEMFLKVEKGQEKKGNYYKRTHVLGKVTFLGRTDWAYWANHCSSADQVIPRWRLPSREAETAVKS